MPAPGGSWRRKPASRSAGRAACSRNWAAFPAWTATRVARWFPIRAIPPLAFDHELILRTALKRMKEDIHFKPLGFDLLPATFTMPQLQNLYEALLEVHFDRRNFAGKMRKLGILEATGERPQGAARSVPVTYRFNRDRYLEMKAAGFKLEF